MIIYLTRLRLECGNSAFKMAAASKVDPVADLYSSTSFDSKTGWFA
jgi:hypothetical protein